MSRSNTSLSDTIGCLALIIGLFGTSLWLYLLWYILDSIGASTLQWCVFAAYVPIAFVVGLMLQLASLLKKEKENS
jgi:hypothetical protein